MPHVYLLSRPAFTDAHEALLADILPPDEARWKEDNNITAAERLVEFAGRICYVSFGRAQSERTNAEYIRNLLMHGHDSVLEHAVWTFALTGVSRAFTHQLVRHRIGFSYSQLSQQYHDESNARFIRPRELDSIPAAAAIWDRSVSEARRAYKDLSNEISLKTTNSGREARRALRSAARSVLPNSIESVIVVTANARAIRHFLSVRGGIVGDSEMRTVSAALLQALEPEAPAIFADFTIELMDDDLPLVKKLPLK